MPMPNEMIPTKALEWALGDQHAANLITEIARLSRRIDDVADGDSPDVPNDLVLIVDGLLMRVAGNPFYQKYAASLGPLLVVICGLWRRTDVWRKDPDRNVRMAGYVYREAVEMAAFTVAFIVGGPVHAASVMDDVIKTTRANSNETFEMWEQE